MPRYFQQKVEAFLSEKHISVNRLESSYETLSARYRAGSEKGYAHTDEISAYLAARLPATYGAVRQVLRQIPDDVRNAITSWLDLGAGPGTASMAALDMLPALSEITLVEQDDRMHQAAQFLWGESAKHYPQTRLTLRQNFIGAHAQVLPHDAVILSYVLSELSAQEQTAAVQYAWAQTRRALVLIVPGTSKSAEDLLRHRDWLIKEGGVVLAPCPHQKACPVAGASDWCHFTQRIPRTALHRQMKQAALGYEDEKFSYLIISRHPADAASIANRIIKHPLKRKGHVIMDTCTSEGNTQRRMLTGKDRTAYAWGDLLLGSFSQDS